VLEHGLQVRDVVEGTRPVSTATSGRAREYKVRDHLTSLGYPFVMRAAASKGPGDLLHGHPLIGAVLVQVGTANKQLNQEGRDRFCEAADLTGALPVLATVIATPGHPTVIRYWHVTRDIPSTWKEWTP
jgi:hypothetical protein